MDGQPFLHYGREKGRAEPGAVGRSILGVETWDTESKDLTENGKDFRMTLQKSWPCRSRKEVRVGRGNREPVLSEGSDQ